MAFHTVRNPTSKFATHHTVISQMTRHAFLVAPWLAAFALLSFFSAPVDAQKQKKGGKHEIMDYGPFLSATITAPTPAKNTANKAVAIRLGDKGAICFDTDLCRWSCAWTGEFLNLRGTPFDGGHGAHPTIKGVQTFGTRPMPGWAKPGGEDFSDPRSEPYGPLDHSHARYKGLYLHEDKVVVSYTAGDAKILELPGVVSLGDNMVFTRTINISTTKQTLTHVVAEVEKAKGSVVDNVATLEGSKPTLVGLSAAPKGTVLEVKDGRVLLKLLALGTPTQFRIFVAQVPKEEAAKFTELVSKSTADLDLAKYTKAGPGRWKETVTTKGTRAADTAAYVTDEIAVPEKNPYNSWMRIGGMDFFSDGRIAVCTWSGDVWVVSGIDDKLDKLTWKRFATGLFQPLGLKIVDDKVHTLGREGIVRLHDTDGDGEADFYEAFNNDVATTPGFHEFAFDLHTDPEGNFYYAKGGPVRGGGRGFEYIARHSGCILKVSKDGTKHEVYATGFRAPNGIGVGPRGEVTSGDNEGTWMPQCRLSLALPGSFNGCVDTAHQKTPPADYDRPICWFPKNVDNSSGGQVWVTSNKWGPLAGYLLHMSYGQSSLYQVMLDREGKSVQGGVVKLPLKLMTGVCRGRFSDKDGQLYLTGLRGWQTNAPRDAALQRVRYTGKPYVSVLGMKAVKGGVELTFSDKLDPKSAADADSYSAQQWNYLWCSNYGSSNYKPVDGFDAKVLQYNAYRAQNKSKEAQALLKELPTGTEQVKITAAKLGEDGKTVTLAIEHFKPVMQMHLKYRLKTADGTTLSQEIHNTVNRIP